MRCSEATRLAALESGFCGNRMPSIERSRTLLRSGSSIIVRLIPIRPPIPLSVKPKPRGSGGNSAVMINSSEKPFCPGGRPGSRVVSSPMALRAIFFLILS